MPRLPHPMAGYMDDPLAPIRRNGDGDAGNKRAVQWARWHAERLGIEFPGYGRDSDLNARVVDYGTQGAPEHYCIVTRTSTWHERLSGRYVRRHEREEVLRFPVPAHCAPMKDAGAWHAAHQAGLPLAECKAEGQSYRKNAERTEKARATRQAKFWAKYDAAVEACKRPVVP